MRASPSTNRERPALSRTVDVILLGCAIVLLAMAVAGLGAGLHFAAVTDAGNAWVGPDLALCLAAIALGLPLMNRSGRSIERASAFLGAIALVIAAERLVVHLWQPAWLPRTDLPGAMDMGSALAVFVAAAIQIYVALVDHQQSSGQKFITGGVVIGAFGLGGLLAAGSGLSAPGQWHIFFSTPVMASAAFAILAFAMLLEGWRLRHQSDRARGIAYSSALNFTGLLLDLSTPLIGSNIVYIPVVLSTLWFGTAKMPLHFAFMSTLFSIIAFFAETSNPDELLPSSLARLFGISTIWVVAFLIFYFKAAAQQIEAGRTRFEAVLNNSPDAVVTIDETGHIHAFNKSAEIMFGYSAAELAGKNVSILMPEPYHSGHDGYLRRYAETGERRIIGTIREVLGRRKDGHIFPIDLSISVLSEGADRQFVGIIRNLTARKEQEEILRSTLRQLANYTADLERSNQELDEFAYIASHDLKEPLRGLHNHSRFLLEDYETLLDQDGKRRLNRLVFLTQRMEKLVNDLLYFSRIGRQELAVRPTDLNLVLRDVVLTLEQFLEERHAKVMIEGVLPTLTCDATRVTEVYRNLVANGVKYNDKSEKRIDIGWYPSRADDHGTILQNVLYVRDNGKGIPAEFHQDIFRIFKRLENSSPEEEGTGVGLTFVKKIIARHRGKIWLESEPGIGTTFFFTLEASA